MALRALDSPSLLPSTLPNERHRPFPCPSVAQCRKINDRIILVMPLPQACLTQSGHTTPLLPSLPLHGNTLPTTVLLSSKMVRAGHFSNCWNCESSVQVDHSRTRAINQTGLTGDAILSQAPQSRSLPLPAAPLLYLQISQPPVQHLLLKGLRTLTPGIHPFHHRLLSRYPDTHLSVLQICCIKAALGKNNSSQQSCQETETSS